MSRIQPYAAGFSQTEPLAGVLALLTNAAVTGDPIAWPGGKGTLTVLGTFNGATVALQFSPDSGTTWIAVGAQASFTAQGLCNFEAAAGQIRMAVTGGTPSGLNATMRGYA